MVRLIEVTDDRLSAGIQRFLGELDMSMSYTPIWLPDTSGARRWASRGRGGTPRLLQLR